jgi:hypothetical protein
VKCTGCGQFHPDDWSHDQKAKFHVGAKLAKYTADEKDRMGGMKPPAAPKAPKAPAAPKAKKK